MIAPGLRDTGKSEGLYADARNHSLWIAFLPLCLSLSTPAVAWGDIYQWTDEGGNPVISNILPDNRDKLTKFSVVVKEESKPPTLPPVTYSQNVATPIEQMLLDKIDRLERRLQTRPNSPPVEPVPPASYYGNYYSTQPAPLAPQPIDYRADHPIDYPTYYYPLVPLYSYAVYPARAFVNRSTFVFPHNSFNRGRSMHRGRR